jgi:hypothetical protein
MTRWWLPASALEGPACDHARLGSARATAQPGVNWAQTNYVARSTNCQQDRGYDAAGNLLGTETVSDNAHR